MDQRELDAIMENLKQMKDDLRRVPVAAKEAVGKGDEEVPPPKRPRSPRGSSHK